MSEERKYPCDYLGDCPYLSNSGYSCKDHCNYGTDEKEDDK